jgi:hypothetical protein
LCFTAPPEAKVIERAPQKPKDIDVAEVMLKIKTRVLRDRIRLDEFIRDFDPLRKGFVTQHQIEAGLSAASLPVSFDDIVALGKAYQDTRVLDAAGEPMVAWRRLVDDVNLVFTTPGLERDPGADVDVRSCAVLPVARALGADDWFCGGCGHSPW